jgi:hypothetical protein
MTENEGGPKQPIPDDRERDPAGAAGNEAKQEDESSSGEGAGRPDGVGRAAIDVDLAHDRAS